MDKPFEISFEFPLENSLHTIPLKAKVQLHHSEPHYVVDSFAFRDDNYIKSDISLLPSIDLKYQQKGNKGVWIHKDSGRESLLSRAIGNAIEKSGRFTKE